MISCLMGISAKDIFSVPPTPSAESVGKAAKRRVVMPEWTGKKDPSLAVLDHHNTQKFITQPALKLMCCEQDPASSPMTVAPAVG